MAINQFTMSKTRIRNVNDQHYLSMKAKLNKCVLHFLRNDALMFANNRFHKVSAITQNFSRMDTS